MVELPNIGNFSKLTTKYVNLAVVVIDNFILTISNLSFILIIFVFDHASAQTSAIVILKLHKLRYGISSSFQSIFQM